MKKRLFVFNVLLLTFIVAFCVGCSDEQSPSDDSPKATVIATAGKTEGVLPTPTPTSTENITYTPSEEPTVVPTEKPTEVSTVVPTEKPTEVPTVVPTEKPTEVPTAIPTETPVEKKIKINYIKDGLFALYEGTFNTLDGFDDTTFWDDLSGNNNHIEEVDNDGERIFFDEDKGLFLDHKEVFFPDEIVEMINTNCYTVELKLSELEIIGENFATLINNHCGGNKGNDKFALFIRNTNGHIEFKNSSNARPKKENGFDLVNGHTLTITFDLEAGFCKMYSDGVLIAEEVPTAEMDVDMKMFVGNGTDKKEFSAYIQSVRFYDRALTDAEVLHNATIEAGVTLE